MDHWKKNVSFENNISSQVTALGAAVKDCNNCFNKVKTN